MDRVFSLTLPFIIKQTHSKGKAVLQKWPTSPRKIYTVIAKSSNMMKLLATFNENEKNLEGL